MKQKVSLRPILRTLSGRCGGPRRAILLCLTSMMALAALAQVGSANGPHIYAIKDARIVTVTNGTIAKGTVVVRDGLIEAVGQQVTVPADARIIDGSGLTVYPGLIDGHTDLAIKQQRPQPGSGRGGGSPPQRPAAPAPSERPSMHPDRLAMDMIEINASKLEKARNVGVTTALVIPRRGIFIGQSALINLAGEKPAQMVIQSPVAMHIGFDRAGFRAFPASLMGVVSYIRQTLYDAQHYRREWDRYERTKRGLRRPAPDHALEGVQPVLAGQLPVVLVANEAKEVRRVIKLAEEFNLKLIISGASQGYEVADLLREKQTPVLLSLNFPARSKDADPEADIPLRVLQLQARAPETAAALHRAGVKFAFSSGFSSDPKDVIKNAAKAIDAGLPEQEALKAFTINAAEIFGVAEQLGSIETGKIANLVLADGDLFDEKTRVKRVFVDGREFEIKQPPKRPDKAEAEAGATVDASGAWNLVIDSPQGPLDVTATIEQSGTDITGGTLSSAFGDSNVTGGSVNGSRVRFKVLVDMQGQPMEIEFEGTIEGNSINGSASGPMGTMSFTGTRPS